MDFVPDFAALVAAVFAAEDRPLCPKARFERRRGGRIYGHGSRKYSGPRDPSRRRLRLTPARLRALNVAWNHPEQPT